jgi:class 3 adenylate cyclase
VSVRSLVILIVFLVAAVAYGAMFLLRERLQRNYRKTHFARADGGGLTFAPLGLASMLYRRTFLVAEGAASEALVRIHWRGLVTAATVAFALYAAALLAVFDRGARIGDLYALVAISLWTLSLAVLLALPAVPVLRACRELPAASRRSVKDALASQERLLGSAWIAWAWSASQIAVAGVFLAHIRESYPELVAVAWVAGVGSLLAAVLGPVVLKLRALRIEHERLERLVAARTDELRLANASLAERARELAATNAQVRSQSEQLAEWNAKLEERVSDQVHQLEKLARLKRFVSPKISDLIIAGQLDDPLATRRREVTIVFIDLRGFTAFSEIAAPEDVMGVLHEYHAEIGRLANAHDGTVEHFAGDGVMLIFNDPAPLPDPALAAVRMATEVRDAVARLGEDWRRLGHHLGCGLGIAQGYATIGTIGFEGRNDYGVVGAVTNLAARLCTHAAAGQVLISQRVYGRVEDKVTAEPVGALSLKGVRDPVPAYSVVSMKPAATEPATLEQASPEA